MISKKKRIFCYLKTLPKDKIVTYKFLANKFKTSPRAIGAMMKSNKDKSVPCYKVIKSDGTPGGYNGLLGKNKKELLNEINKKNNNI
ncbi:MAG: MGMT family protein [Candidatus Pacearchaeota archaeon]